MNNTIRCIHCGKEFKPSDALAHELQEEMKKITKSAEVEAKKKVAEEFAEKEKERNKQLLEEKQKNKELVETIAITEKKRKEAEEKIREETTKEATEKYRLEKLEYEKKFADMQKALEEAQRKGKQGSQQLQGEVLELDLEEQLKSSFPYDEFLPIPKGVEGGDLWQKIRDERGTTAGSILWETKRTKAWANSWLPKLREDARKVGASESILISQVLPDKVKNNTRKDGVWVSNYEYALDTARFVRFLIMKVAAAKSASTHKDEELKEIYDYITSDAFKHKFEAHQEGVRALRDDLIAERRATEIRWKKREIQIERLDKSSLQMYGELQGIVPELPDIQLSSTASEADADDS